MRIGFDGKRAMNNHTGLGHYSRNTIYALASHTSYELHCYSPRIHSKLDKKIAPSVHRHTCPSRYPSILWRSKTIIQDLLKQNIDVYHGLSGEIPIGIHHTPIKTVVTIHDLIFKRFPQWYRPVDRLIYDLKSRYACTNAHRIIAISEQTKADIIHFYNIPAHKIEVVYQNCHPDFEKITLPQIKSNQNPYILCVGSLIYRKNQKTLVQAFRQIASSSNVKLILIGDGKKYKQEILQYIQKHQLQQRVNIISHVSQEKLIEYYQNALISIYPSQYEGFGIPIIESLFVHTPVIAGNNACLKEAGGPHSLYVDTQQSHHLAHAIQRLIHNPSLKEKLKKEGWIYAQNNFSALTVSKKLSKTYERLIKT